MKKGTIEMILMLVLVIPLVANLACHLDLSSLHRLFFVFGLSFFYRSVIRWLLKLEKGEV